MLYLIHCSTIILMITLFSCKLYFAFYVVLLLLGSIEMFSIVVFSKTGVNEVFIFGISLTFQIVIVSVIQSLTTRFPIQYFEHPSSDTISGPHSVDRYNDYDFLHS